MDFEQLVGKKELDTPHDEFYDDIIEKLGGLDAVKNCVPFDKETLKERLAEDENLNNTPMRPWDLASGFYNPNAQGYKHVRPVPCELRTLLGNIGVTSYANSQGVCLLKRIAVHIATET